jgi:hypothetical protein
VTRKCDESITAARTSNLMKNPANGGIPLLEKIRKAKKILTKVNLMQFLQISYKKPMILLT